MTISDLVARFARTTPDAIAFRDGDLLTLTWAQTHARVSRLASVLADRGVGPGDRVALLGLNSVPVIESIAATLRLGAICVPGNFRLVTGEVAYVLADSGATTILVDDVFAPLAQAAGATTPGTIGAGYDDLLAGGSEEYVERPVDDTAPALIMYTSGTTGRAWRRCSSCRRSGPRSSPCPTSPSATSRRCAPRSGAPRRPRTPCCAA